MKGYWIGLIGLLAGQAVFAADNTSQQIQMLNSQIQSQLQTMQATQQKQMKDLNTQIQAQLKEMQGTLDTKINTMNSQIQNQLKTVQDNLQKQVKQVHDENLKAAKASQAEASANGPASKP